MNGEKLATKGHWANRPAQLSFCKIGELSGKADGQLVRVPKAILHQGPVGHPPVPGHRVEVEVAIQVVPHPLHLMIKCSRSTWTHEQPYLPHHIRVLSIGSRAHVVRGPIHPLLKVIDSHASVVEATNQHVRMVRVDVTRHHLFFQSSVSDRYKIHWLKPTPQCV